MKLKHLDGEHFAEKMIAATTITGTSANAIFRAPFRCTVTGAYVLPDAAMTGHTTDNATATMTNKAQDGTGTGAVASLAFANTVNLAAFDEKALTLSTTAATLDLAEGDVLSFAWAKGGSGLVTPGCVVGVKFKAR